MTTHSMQPGAAAPAKPHEVLDWADDMATTLVAAAQGSPYKSSRQQIAAILRQVRAEGAVGPRPAMAMEAARSILDDSGGDLTVRRHRAEQAMIMLDPVLAKLLRLESMLRTGDTVNAPQLRVLLLLLRDVIQIHTGQPFETNMLFDRPGFHPVDPAHHCTWAPDGRCTCNGKQCDYRASK